MKCNPHGTNKLHKEYPQKAVWHFRQQSGHWLFQEVIFAKGLTWTRYIYVVTVVILTGELSKPVFAHLVLNFFITLFFIKNVTCDIFWYISLCVWFDFRVFVLVTIFLYLCVLEVIWVLFWTIIWKFMVYFTLAVFNVTSFFGENWLFLYLYLWI